MTQKEIIIKYLDYVGDWIPAYKLRGLSTPFGFSGHQADRRARELAQAGKIDHKINGKYAYYKRKDKELEKSGEYWFSDLDQDYLESILEEPNPK